MLEKFPPICAIIDKLRRRYHAFDQFCCYWHIRRQNFKEEPPLLIYQMGKVGSSSVRDSLIGKFGCEIYHIHTLTKKNLKRLKKSYKDAGLPVADHVIRGAAITTKLKREFHNVNWRIITLVRDIVKRDISSFFQNLDRYKEQFLDQDGQWNEKKMINHLQQELDHIDEASGYGFRWFDGELKAHFGMDIFQYRFPKDKGYQIIEEKNVRVLIFRLEDLSKIFSPAIKEFLKTDRDIPLVVTNKGEDKEYVDVYKRVRKKIQLPEDVARGIYNTKLMRHFYTDEQREKMTVQWLR